MNNCRHCGGETVAAICWPCVEKVQRLCERAHAILPLMVDEIAKDTAKASIGSASGGDKTVISLHALEARDNLKKVIIELQDRARRRKDGVPLRLKEDAKYLQELAYGQSADDPLWHLVADFQWAVFKCTTIIDVRKEKTTAGICVCGSVLKHWADTGSVVCDKCRHISTVEEAADRLRQKLDRSVYEAWLDDENMVTALFWAYGKQVKQPTLRKWVQRGHLQRDDKKRMQVCEVLDFIERKELEALAKS